MTTREIIDGLEMLCFFNQRAGRELWGDKPKQIQDKDIEHADRILYSAISALQACDTCKHDPPEMDKWPCMDCDMREPADRWEAKDVPDINVGDMISKQAAIDLAHELIVPNKYKYGLYNQAINNYCVEIMNLPSAQSESTRTFVELVVEYPDPELCTYKEYKGKPYYSIKYIESGEIYVGYGTYSPKVLSQYLREYFMIPAQPELSEVAVSAIAVDKMLKDLLPEKGVWEIEGDEAKTAICEVIRDALEGLWKLPLKPNSIGSSLTQKALDNDLPSAKPERCEDCENFRKARLLIPQSEKRTEECTETHACDLISRQAALDCVTYDVEYTTKCIKALPSAQPDNHEVACLLAELFGDTCACNFNDIDEWLPDKCEFLDACPDPGGVTCWEQFLKHRAERITDEQTISE